MESCDPAEVTSFTYDAGPLRNATEQDLDYLNDNDLLNVLSKEDYEVAAEQMQYRDEDHER
jgi:hypothetical protein